MPSLYAPVGLHDTLSHRQRLLPATTDRKSLIRHKNAIRSGRANASLSPGMGNYWIRPTFRKLGGFAVYFQNSFPRCSQGTGRRLHTTAGCTSAGSRPPQGRAGVGEVAGT